MIHFLWCRNIDFLASLNQSNQGADRQTADKISILWVLVFFYAVETVVLRLVNENIRKICYVYDAEIKWSYLPSCFSVPLTYWKLRKNSWYSIKVFMLSNQFMFGLCFKVVLTSYWLKSIEVFKGVHLDNWFLGLALFNRSEKKENWLLALNNKGL